MADEKRVLFVVDGHSIVFRAWFALADRLTTKSGVPTQGALGFTRMFVKALKAYRPTHAAITFDTKAKTFREASYPQYKAHRPPTDPELHAQIPIVKDIMTAFAVPCYEKDGFEADDVVGTLSRAASAQGFHTIILTGDADQLQLVDKNVELLMYSGFGDIKLYDVEKVRAKYDGLGPEFVAQIKALAGDKSDNIPGVPGIGEKTTTRLLNHFGGLQQLFDNLDTVTAIDGLRGALRIQKLLSDNRQQAWDSFNLATIVRDVPLEFNLEDTRLGQHNTKQLRDTLLKYEFNSLVRQLVDENKITISAPAERAVEVTAEVVNSVDKLQAMVKKLNKAGSFAYDTETDGVDPMRANIVGISFACDDKSGWYVPLGHDKGDQLELSWVLETLRGVFEDEKIGKVAHNANFDMTVLAAVGIEVREHTFDTMIAAALCGVKQVGLKQLSSAIFKEKMTPISDLIGTGRNQITMNQVEIEPTTGYAVADAVITWRLARHFAEEIKTHAQTKVFNDIEMPFLPVVVEMQKAGFLLDTSILEVMSAEINAKIEEMEQAIARILPEHQFNINSTRQLAEVLFDKLNAPRSRRIKTGWSVDENALETLLQKEVADDRVHQLAAGVLQYRALAKLKSTYVDALPDLVNEKTGRIHTTFNQVGSDTGRLSSTNPNIQNIPVRTKLGRMIRSAFHADVDKGYMLLSADYSQIELRILAHVSQEPGLLASFHNGEDIHTVTAQQMYEVEEVNSEQRRVAKILNFGVIYGLGPYGIARQTNLSQAQGKEFIALYFGKYPGIKNAITQAKENARKKGYAETMFGRRRYLPDIRTGKGHIFAAAERIAVNMPIQGAAADIVKIAMVNIAQAIENRGLSSRMIAQIHDEIIFEMAPNEKDELQPLVVEQMTNAADLSVPLEVKLRSGPNWGSLL